MADELSSKSVDDEEWKSRLSPEDYKVLREKGTEPAFSGRYNEYHGPGIFICKGCGQPLFDSKTKYDSGSGWPSFTKPINETSVSTEKDLSLGIARVEVKCSNCDGHLGHVFEDGPSPLGTRYCINSASLNLEDSQKRDSSPSSNTDG